MTRLWGTVLIIIACGAVAINDAYAADDAGKAEIAFYSGVLHYRQGQKDQARRDFVNAKQLAQPGPVRELSDSYIRSIDEGSELAVDADSESTKKGRRWFAYASVDTAYDSNVPLNPDDLTLATLPTDKQDAVFAVRGGGGYKAVQTTHYQMTPQAYYYQSLHPQLEGFNYGLTHAEIDNRFSFDKVGGGLPVMYEFSTLGSSKFVQSFIANPTTSYFWKDRFLTQVGMLTNYSDFFQTITGPQDRDAWNIQPGVSQYVFFNDRKHYVSVGYNFEHNFADGSDWVYNANTISASALLPLPAKLDLYVFGRFTVDMNFANVDSIIGTKRKDTIYMAGANLNRKFMEFLDVNLHYNFWYDDSNQAFFKYSRNLVGVSLGVTY